MIFLELLMILPYVILILTAQTQEEDMKSPYFKYVNYGANIIMLFTQLAFCFLYWKNTKGKPKEMPNIGGENLIGAPIMEETMPYQQNPNRMVQNAGIGKFLFKI